MRFRNGLALCALLLAGCVNGPARRPDVSNGTDGLVYAALLGSGGPGYVEVQQLATQTKYPLRYEVVVGDGTLHAWVPPGNYRIVTWGGVPFKKYASFHVDARKVTDLGVLANVPVGGYQFAVMPLSDATMPAPLKAIQARFSASLDGAEPIHWTPNQAPPILHENVQSYTGLGLIADMIQAYALKVNRPPLRQKLRKTDSVQAFFDLAKSGTPPLTTVGALGPQGFLYYGGLFGEIRVRHADASWGAIDTGSLRRVTALTWRGDSLVAGYADGSIRLSRDQGKTWTQVARPRPVAVVMNISWTGKTWLVETFDAKPGSLGMWEGRRLDVYQSVGDSFAHLRDIKTVSAKAAFNSSAAMHDNAFYVSSGKRMDRLDLATGRWKRLNVPTYVSGFDFNAKGKALTVFRIAGLFSRVYVSYDGGESWKREPRPPLILVDARFITDSHGVAVRIKPGMFRNSMELLSLEPGGRSWSVTEHLPEGCKSVLDDADGTPRFCVTAGAAILSKLNGKWHVESAPY